MAKNRFKVKNVGRTPITKPFAIYDIKKDRIHYDNMDKKEALRKSRYLNKINRKRKKSFLDKIRLSGI